jgi:tetratricopeptide (TPR) repeat protein
MTQGNLAQAYHAAGKLAQATQLIERVRDASVRKLGAEHPVTLVSVQLLGTVYRDANRLPEAIELFQQVRAAQVRKLGADHPEIFVTLNNLALAYRAAGKLPEAIELFEQAHDGDVKRLGADHPDTLTTTDNLAIAYAQAGKLPEAIELLEQVRDLRLAKFGPDHVDTLTTLNNLAGTYRAAGRHADATLLIEQVHRGFVKKLGPEHPDSLTLGFNLASCYYAVGRVPEAIELYEQVRDARTRSLGPDDPYTLSTLNALGEVYHAAGTPEQAIPLVEQAAQGFETLKFQHQFAPKAVGNLIAWLEELGRYAEAETWRRKWLAVVKERVGPEHPAYGGELASLGLNLLKQSKWTDAEPALRECLALREKLAAGQDPSVLPWQVANVKSMLGEALAHLQGYSAAEPLLLAGYEGLKEHEATLPPQAKIRLTEALERLVEFYAATDQVEKRDEWRAKLEETKAVEKVPKPNGT